jgi:hypothetical protein
MCNRPLNDWESSPTTRNGSRAGDSASSCWGPFRSVCCSSTSSSTEVLADCSQIALILFLAWLVAFVLSPLVDLGARRFHLRGLD